MIETNISLELFNVIRYVITSLLLLPVLEVMLERIVVKMASRELADGKEIPWREDRIGRLSVVSHSYSKTSGALVVLAALALHALAIYGESGFGGIATTETVRSDVKMVVFGSEPIIDRYCWAINSTNSLVNVVIGRDVDITSKAMPPGDCTSALTEERDARLMSNVSASEYMRSVGAGAEVEVVSARDENWQTAYCSRVGRGHLKVKVRLPSRQVVPYNGDRIVVDSSDLLEEFRVNTVCLSGGALLLDNFPDDALVTNLTLVGDGGLIKYFLSDDKAYQCLGIDSVGRHICWKSDADGRVDRVYKSESEWRYSGKVKLSIFALFKSRVRAERVKHSIWALHRARLMTSYATHGSERMLDYRLRELIYFTVLMNTGQIPGTEGSPALREVGSRTVATINNRGLAMFAVLISIVLTVAAIDATLTTRVKRDAMNKPILTKPDPQSIMKSWRSEILRKSDCLGNSDEMAAFRLTKQSDVLAHMTVVGKACEAGNMVVEGQLR